MVLSKFTLMIKKTVLNWAKYFKYKLIKAMAKAAKSTMMCF